MGAGFVIVDVHCHIGLSARKVDTSIERFSFEADGACARPGYDSYMSPRMLGGFLWRIIMGKLGIDPRKAAGVEMDAAIMAVNDRHLLTAPSVDRFVLLAFDEYHDGAGTAVGPIDHRAHTGTDLYTSNSFVRALCRQHPDKYLFGASVHPYRADAVAALEEVHREGAVLIKWLPVHQNIDAADPRVESFVRRAGQLVMPLLIHYGGEMALRANHKPLEDPKPLFDLLERLRRQGPIPPVIIAHLATPSLPLQQADYFAATADALLRRFADDPVYADISAMTNRPWWLKHVLRRTELHGKLVYGSDFPIPPATVWFPLRLFGKRRELLRHPSLAERSFRIVRALGFPDSVFERAYQVLKHRWE